MTAPRVPLSGARADRAAGVMLAAACGDALGAGYEFGPPIPEPTPVGMVGGGVFGWAPGEWTDDTAMAIPLLRAAAAAHADGVDLLDRLDDVVAAWTEWARDARDVGTQTRAVLTAAARASDPVTATACRHAAVERFRTTGRAGGNGSLMRTAPVALAYLHDPERMAVAARAVSDLTHPDPDAGDACVLWCAAIRHAVLTGHLDATTGLTLLPEDRVALWADRIAEATAQPPEMFGHNGWVVHALQAAWSAISHTPVPPADPAKGRFPAQHLQASLERCVRLGGDTDTVAAIAGALLGAAWGASAVPAAWRRRVHGWPDWTADDLIRHGHLSASRRTVGAGESPSGSP